jgi:hypothetical protein
MAISSIALARWRHAGALRDRTGIGMGDGGLSPRAKERSGGDWGVERYRALDVGEKGLRNR